MGFVFRAPKYEEKSRTDTFDSFLVLAEIRQEILSAFLYIR